MKRTDLAPQRLMAYGIVPVGAVMMVAPFYFMFIFATHHNDKIFTVPLPLWFGDVLGDNLRDLLRRLPHFWKNLGCSFYIALMTTVLNLFFCSLAGLAFTMYDFRWREQLFAAVMPRCCCPASSA